jgi:hypothetical protein
MRPPSRCTRLKRLPEVSERKDHTFIFEDDGVTPNNPKWPLVIYPQSLAVI